MDKKERNDLKLELAARKMVLKKIESAKRSFSGRIAKVKEDRQNRKDALSEYKNEDEILDAYGWGFITEEEYDRLREEFEKGQESIDNEVSSVELADNILNGWAKIMRSDISELEFELLPKKKQDEIREKNYEIILERQKRRTARERENV